MTMSDTPYPARPIVEATYIQWGAVIAGAIAAAALAFVFHSFAAAM
jgi:hypothetical protein